MSLPNEEHQLPLELVSMGLLNLVSLTLFLLFSFFVFLILLRCWYGMDKARETKRITALRRVT